MYTQCPECSVAFRVTAEVLKQAAGKVRCGGCGNPFNALMHLSEEKPLSAPVRAERDSPVNELTPQLPDDEESGERLQAISAEQSAALLKTLDQLAGEDIRIEDTGVEWRVLNDDEELDDDEEPVGLDTREKSVIEQLESIAAAPAAEEMRFDDNTPLPDDFDLDSETAYKPPEPEKIEVIQPRSHPADAQVDLAFGEPDEWEDLLGEVGEPPGSAEDEALEAAAEADVEAPAGDEVTAAEPDTESGSTGDLPLDMDTQFQLQAEAMGIDISGIHESGKAAQDADHAATEVAAIDPADTSIDEDLIAAAFEAEAEARKEVSAAEEMLEELAEAEDDLDIETQLAELEAYAPAEVAEPDDELPPEAIEVAELELKESDVAPDEAPAVNVLEFEEPDEVEDEPELIDDMHVEQELAIEAELAAADVESQPVHELSEEELTINMMIDEDLLAIAVEDDDGFTSTIVQKQASSKDDLPKEKRSATPDGVSDEEDELAIADEENETTRVEDYFAAAARSPLVETIIMEGETIRGELDPEREAEKESFKEQAKKHFASERRSDEDSNQGMHIGMIVGAVLLVLLLAGQFMHQRREALATIPAFNSSIGSIYRSIGQPVTPQWNVSGWRFEATKGDVGDGEELLTIYSRVGNDSEQALPYPLVHVALTDRFEEIIGSKVLEPAEYLAGNPDPRRPVAPGATFDAAISIATPSPEATGFRLDVCYRIASGALRCAIEDFK